MYIWQSLCSLAEAVVLMQNVLFSKHVHHKSNTSQYRVLLHIHQNDCHTSKYRLHQNGCATYKCKSINGHQMKNEKMCLNVKFACDESSFRVMFTDSHTKLHIQWLLLAIQPATNTHTHHAEVMLWVTLSLCVCVCV